MYRWSCVAILITFIVSRRGIFAVETKTVSKPRLRDGKAGYRVVFDGRFLRFPHRSDGSAVGQTEHQAKRLSNFLSQAIGERVSAEGILALPDGWWRGKPDPR